LTEPSGASNERGIEMDESEEYIEACRGAKDALYDLLMLTEPDLGRNLRVAYADLKQWIAKNEGEDDPAVAKARAEEERAEYQRRNAWRATSFERREAYVFQFLGEERLTIGEITDRAKAALHVDYDIYESMLRAQVTRMHKAGQLDREGEQWHSRIRYRYFCKRTLEGPIADLQAALDEGEED
jgi:hypothetical protein